MIRKRDGTYIVCDYKAVKLPLDDFSFVGSSLRWTYQLGEAIMNTIRVEGDSNLIDACRNYASDKPNINLITLADLYDPLLNLSEIYVRLDKDEHLVGICVIFRGFALPSVIVLGDEEAVERELLNFIVQNLDGNFVTISSPDKLSVFEEIAQIKSRHYEYQMLLRRNISFEWDKYPVERVRGGEIEELDRFYRDNEAHAWNPVMLECGPYYCIRQKREIISAAGVHFVNPFVAQIGNVLTAPAYRGKGFATACTAAVADDLSSSNIPIISLFVVADNTPAIHIYEKLGFEKERKVIFAECEPN